jgi:hypothetical protein
LGSCFPESFKIVIRIDPAKTHLNPANSIGGIVSTPILIKRYVVPQRMQIAIQAM